MIWVFVFQLAVLAAIFVAWPLLRPVKNILDRSDSALAIFNDQLAEVDRDAGRGLISEVEAQSARTEIKRRMISADRDRNPTGAKHEGKWLVIAAAAIVPLAGAALYTFTGSPGIPSLPFAERQGEQNDARELTRLTGELRRKLEEDPAGGEMRGWVLLATTYTNMNRHRDAAYAWSQIVERDEATTATWSQYGESLIMAENGIVTPRAEAAIDRALALDPTNPAGTFYQAMAMDQAGQTLDARRLLLERIAAEDGPAPWMEVFLSEANRLGASFGLEPVGLPGFPAMTRGPTQEDIDAASDMSSEDQMEFIRSMVSRLADRLEENPDDLQGWLQLARARIVLGETDGARAALEQAKTLTADLPSDDPRREMVEQGLQELPQ